MKTKRKRNVNAPQTGFFERVLSFFETFERLLNEMANTISDYVPKTFVQSALTYREAS